MENYSDVLESYLIPAEEGALKNFVQGMSQGLGRTGKAALVAILAVVIANRLNELRKVKKSKSNTNVGKDNNAKTNKFVKAYEEYLNTVYDNMPKDAIRNEEILRKMEIKAIRNMASKDIKKDNLTGFNVDSSDDSVSDFLSCSKETIFDTDVYYIMECDGTEYIDEFLKTNTDPSYANYNKIDWYEWCNDYFDKFCKICDEFTKQLNSKFECVSSSKENYDGDKFQLMYYVNLKPSQKFLLEARKSGYMTFEEFQNKK